MKTMFLLLLLVAARMAWSKDLLSVEIKAIHAVTHDDRGNGAVLSKGLMGATAPTRQVESFNLDTVIKGEHVLLTCDDPRGCESPALGSYAGEMRRNKWVELKFSLPLNHKEVSRQYRIAGSW